MFHLPKSLFFPTSRSSFSSSSQLRTLLIPFPVREFSYSSSSPTQPHCKRVEKGNIRVSVWWNFNDCRVPTGVSVLKVPPLIIGAVRANGIEGPINNIVGYGDVNQFSKMERKALSSVGVHLRHFTGKDTANKHFTTDLFNWTCRNPPPVHIFQISGDESLLHHLRMKNYNMLVAYPDRASYVMCSAATIIWSWSLILKGENLIGKKFNYPPDGPLNSWYGDHSIRGMEIEKRLNEREFRFSSFSVP